MSNARRTSLLLLAFDCIATLVVFNVLGTYRGVSPHFMVTPFLGPLASIILATYLIEGYRARTDMMSLDYTSLHIIAFASAALFTLLVTFVFSFSVYELTSSRGVVLGGFVALTALTLGYRRLLYQANLTEAGTRHLVFIGDLQSCLEFKAECVKTKTEQPVIFCSLSPQSETRHPAIDVQEFSTVLEQVQSGKLEAQAIILRESSRDLTAANANKLIELYFNGLPTYTLELFHQVFWQKIPTYRVNQTWLFQEGFEIAREPIFERVKRISDIGMSLIGLTLFAPIIAAAAAAIWIEDRGPIFFRQTRIGKNRVPFKILKLRSMSTRAEEGPKYTQQADPRVTRVGNFLRASRIDELPQVWNVLKGEMSLIGPRAEWDRLVEEYEREIPCYHFRHLVKPGITGWAQVNYPYGANLEDTRRKLEFDLYYIRHFSFLLDASIVLKTVHVMLFGKGR